MKNLQTGKIQERRWQTSKYTQVVCFPMRKVEAPCSMARVLISGTSPKGWAIPCGPRLSLASIEWFDVFASLPQG